MNFSSILRRTAGVAACAFALLPARAAETAPSPRFQEVYEAIRANLPAVSEADLNQAAVQGLLSALRPQISLVTNLPAGAALADLPLLTRTSVFENAFGYLRISHVGAGLGKSIESAVKELQAGHKLTGLILDLRYSGGSDYAGAVEAADVFLDGERALLRFGDTNLAAQASAKTVDLPVATLVNESTVGAAEALAAALQFTRTSLVIGSRTAGQAHGFKEVELSNGQRLKLPGVSAQLPDGTALSPNGVTPDVLISVNAEDERAYFEDPYWLSPRLFSQTGRSNTNDLAGTNRSRRRVNEADLVRMQREGQAPNSELADAPGFRLPPVKIINDPCLARGVDFLKGLAMTLQRR